MPAAGIMITVDVLGLAIATMELLLDSDGPASTGRMPGIMEEEFLLTGTSLSPSISSGPIAATVVASGITVELFLDTPTTASTGAIDDDEVLLTAETNSFFISSRATVASGITLEVLLDA